MIDKVKLYTELNAAFAVLLGSCLSLDLKMAYKALKCTSTHMSREIDNM